MEGACPPQAKVTLSNRVGCARKVRAEGAGAVAGDFLPNWHRPEHHYRPTTGCMRSLTSQSEHTHNPHLTRYLLNLREVLVTHTNGPGGPEVPMTKHRTITGFVAVTLLAAAASVATMRAPSTGRAIGSPDVASLKILTTDENQLQAREFENQPLGTKKPDRYEAIIAN